MSTRHQQKAGKSILPKQRRQRHNIETSKEPSNRPDAFEEEHDSDVTDDEFIDVTEVDDVDVACDDEAHSDSEDIGVDVDGADDEHPAKREPEASVSETVRAEDESN